MKKNSLLILWMLCLCGTQLFATDFTISGKVSLVQEAVPLPFYEVSIADGEGKYVKTVKTSFTGKYSHTFDIPTDEKVQFEIAVIDQCSNNSIIVAIDKEGTDATADFVVCQQGFGDGEDEEIDDNEDETDEGNDDDKDSGLPDFLNCETFGLDIPVCVTDIDGNNTQFGNACEAFDSGFKLKDLTFCGINNGGNGNIFDCNLLEIDLPIDVCVKNADGEDLTLPLCEALSEGYSYDQVEFCEGNGLDGLGNLDSLDCEGLGINFPVCGTDATGNEISFDNPCDALSAGFEINQLNLCAGFSGNGGLGNLDCESLDIDVPFTVCVSNEAGEIQELSLCEALTSGLSKEQLAFCDGGASFLDSLDCEGLGIEIPVCSVDENGNEINFSSPCEALEAGIPLHQIRICEGFIEDGGISGLDCDGLGLEINIPVCITNEVGEQSEIMLCEALTQGISLENIDLCEGALDGIDCSGLGIDLPVCITNEAGESVKYNNPCDALAAGIAINELSFCSGLDSEIFENIDCENFDIDLPFPVCVLTENGEEVEMELCAALSQGFGINNINICDNSIEGFGGDDCETLGLNLPVCIFDLDGNKIEYANPCEAIAAGVKIDDFEFCDDLLEDVVAAAFETTDTKEEELIVETAEIYPNPASEYLNLNLKFSKKMDYDVSIQTINGIAIYRQKYQAINGDNMEQLDVSSLSVGIYVLKVITAKGLKTMKFVKH